MAATNGSAFEQPASFAFDAESEAELAKIVARYPAGKQASAVIPALYIVQNQMKRQTGSAWVPLKGMDPVGARLVKDVLPPIASHLPERALGRRVCGSRHDRRPVEDLVLVLLRRDYLVPAQHPDPARPLAAARCPPG